MYLSARSSPRDEPAPAVDFLVRVPLFSELEAEDLEALATELRWARYSAGEVIFLRGDPGNSLYVIASGTVKLGLTSPEGKEFLLDLLGPGSFFGELALLDGEPRSVDAITVEACQLYLLSRPDFLKYVEQRPGVSTRLLAVLSRRLRRDANVLEGAAFLDVPGRLSAAILQLAQSLGEPGPDGSLVVSSRLTQAELAGLVGSTRESVNRILSAYERLGWVTFKGGRLKVLKPEKLRERLRSGQT